MNTNLRSNTNDRQTTGMSLSTRLYIGAVIAAGALVLGTFAPRGVTQPMLALTFLVAMIVVSLFKLRLPLGDATMSMAYVIDFAVIATAGADLAMVIAAVGTVVQCTSNVRRRQPWYRTAFSVATVVLAVRSAGLVWAALGGSIAAPSGAVLALLVAAVPYFAINTGLVAAGDRAVEPHVTGAVLDAALPEHGAERLRGGRRGGGCPARNDPRRLRPAGRGGGADGAVSSRLSGLVPPPVGHRPGDGIKDGELFDDDGRPRGARRAYGGWCHAPGAVGAMLLRSVHGICGKMPAPTAKVPAPTAKVPAPTAKCLHRPRRCLHRPRRCLHRPACTDQRRCLHRPAKMPAPTSEGISTDQRRCLHRPAKMPAPTSEGACTDQRRCLHRPTKDARTDQRRRLHRPSTARSSVSNPRHSDG